MTDLDPQGWRAIRPPAKRYQANRRWITDKFKERERAFGDYARAKRWEQIHLADLIASARNGKPLEGRRDR